MTWIIALQPSNLGVWGRLNGAGVLQHLGDIDDIDEIAGAVEAMAYTMERDQAVPQLEEWAGVTSRCRIIKRIGKYTYVCYVDAFRRSNETGLSAGLGYLRAIRRTDENTLQGKDQ